jgi:hypothetical protein
LLFSLVGLQKGRRKVMVRLELSNDDAEKLRVLCQQNLSDLRMEIAGTDRVDFREELKLDKAFLEGLIARLATPVSKG